MDLTGTDARQKLHADLDKRLRDRKQNDLRKILSMREGRRFIWDLLEAAYIFRRTYTGNSDTHFNEGRRDIGLKILHELMAAKPDAFMQMQREHIQDLKELDEVKRKESEE